MNSPEVTEWRFHIGVHKTGTTHLQNMLASRVDELRARSVTFLPLEVARPLLRSHILRRPDNRRRTKILRALPVVGGRFRNLEVGRQAEALYSDLCSAQNVRGPLVISEENILRNPWNWRDQGNALYPNLQFLHCLEALAAKAPLNLFVAIRSLEGFTVSYYCERLKHEPLRRSDFDAKLAALKSEPPRWVDLICRIRRHVPSARIEVWNYDDYSERWADLHASLCGCPLEPVPDIGRPSRTRSPSESAVRKAEDFAMEAGSERAERVREIYAEGLADAGATFDPIDGATRSLLRDAFARDLDAIDRSFPGALRKFG